MYTIYILTTGLLYTELLLHLRRQCEKHDYNKSQIRKGDYAKNKLKNNVTYCNLFHLLNPFKNIWLL